MKIDDVVMGAFNTAHAGQHVLRGMKASSREEEFKELATRAELLRIDLLRSQDVDITHRMACWVFIMAASAGFDMREEFKWSLHTALEAEKLAELVAAVPPRRTETFLIDYALEKKFKSATTVSEILSEIDKQARVAAKLTATAEYASEIYALVFLSIKLLRKMEETHPAIVVQLVELCERIDRRSAANT